MKKVLIIDDSIVARKLIQKIMKELHPDWEFHEASSGEESIQICKTDKKFDLITVDCNMPGISGIEVIPTIKDIQKHAKIVMITANTQNSIKLKIQELNAELIEKPLTMEKIKLITDMLENVN